MMKIQSLKQTHKYLTAIAAILVLSACATNRTNTAVVAPTTSPATAAPTAVLATQAPTEAPTATTAAVESKPTEAAKPTEASTSKPAETTQSVVFKIDQSQSKATFTLDEKLAGNPKTVVGTSPGVSGDITVNPADPSQSKIGTIQIDASQFATDSGFRDRAIKNFILQTSKEGNKFITFEPTTIEGLPTKVDTGAAISFKVTGNLTIRGVSQPVTFETTLTQKSDTELSGTAKTTVKRSAYQLEIPSVPSVADVTDDVALEFTFVATKA